MSSGGNSDNNSDLTTEKEFVAELIANKELAWVRWIDFSAKIFARHRKELSDFGLTVDDLVNETYVQLTKKDFKQLRGFLENGRSFIGFTFFAVKAAKKQLLRKKIIERGKTESDSILQFTLTGQKDDQLEEGLLLEHYREALKQAFSLLWQSNSQRAYVYMLRRKMEFSSKQVAALLGLTVSNIDVTLKRAEQEMKDILMEMGINDDIL